MEKQIHALENRCNIPGRIRIRLNALKNNQILCKKINKNLAAVTGILEVNASCVTSRILVVYDSGSISPQELKERLQAIVCPAREQKANKGKVIRANFAFNRQLSAQEFARSRNMLSREYLQYNIRAFQQRPGIPNANGEDLWYDLSAEETRLRFGTDPVQGLTSTEAQERLHSYGRNTLKTQKKKTWFSALLGQFDSVMVKLLLAASGISFALGHILDAISILVIVSVEAAIGMWQECKAQKSVESLQKLSAPVASVTRDGIRMEIPADQVAVGDLLHLAAGDVVPADARLIESHGIQAIESSLTGEAFPVYKKNTRIARANVPLGDRSNMVYMGTSIVKGHARAIVVATGMRTEMGRIAGMLDSVEQERTPLQKDLDRLAKYITWGCALACAGITLAGILSGRPLIAMFATGLSLAVGAIPEGLATILAISFAFGSQRMARKNAIVKSLPSMETLSCTRVICTDKTGTLTQNRMTVRRICTLDKCFDIGGEGYSTCGDFSCNGKKIEPSGYEDLQQLLTAAALCNNAGLVPKGGGNYDISGDPTEAAMLIAVKKSGIRLRDFNCYKREHEIPFDPDTKRMIAVCSDQDGARHAFLKGAVDQIVQSCSRVMENGEIRDIGQEATEKIHAVGESMASQAFRVLALAYKPLPQCRDARTPEDLDKDFIFLGLVGILDPPRPRVEKAIQKCRDAGIKVVMITGDHKNTAAAVARSIGLLSGRGIVLSSEEMDAMTDGELEAIIDDVEVFARSCPEQKLRIVRALKRKGHIVAMTGDGVNDAPALKEAHIGIAMGKSGTEVAKEASSILLADDNFNTVVAAVEEGRTVNRNIKKFLKYVLTGNLAEVFAIFATTIMRLPSPLVPAQILMINLVTEGIPALSLGMDPPEKDVMNEPSRDPGKSIFDRKLQNRILARGLSTGLTMLGVFGGVLVLTQNLVKARTMAFASLVSGQMLHALECSSDGGLKNKLLFPSVAISIGILLASIYIPPLAGVLEMGALNLLDWAAILLSTAVLGRLGEVIHSLIQRRRRTVPTPQPCMP